MEIYCHPVANGTYYFSGACSSTGSLNSRLLVALFHLSRFSMLTPLAVIRLQHFNMLAASLPLPHITFILFCVGPRLTPSCVSTLLPIVIPPRCMCSVHVLPALVAKSL